MKTVFLNIRYLCCTLLFLLNFSYSSAQFSDKKYYLIDSLNISELSEQDKATVDSLLKVYHSAKTDSVRIKSLLSLTFLEAPGVWIRYNWFLQKEIGKIFGNKNRTVGEKFLNRVYGKALYNLYYYYAEQNNEDYAQEYLYKAIEPFKKGGDKSGLADTYNAIGLSLSKKGKIEESIKYYQLSLAIAESKGDKAGIAYAYLSMGHVYRDIDEFDKAIEKYNKALKLFEEVSDGESIADTWNYLGVAYKWNKDSAASLTAYENSLKKSIEINYDYGIATARLNIGIDFVHGGYFEKAISYFQQSLAYYKKMENPNGVVYCLSNMADAHNLMKEYDKAILYGKEALDLSKEIGYPESILSSSKVLQNAFRKRGMYKEALETMDLYHAMMDSIKDSETQRKALKAQLDFEKQKEVFELKKEQENRNIVAEQEKKQKNIIIIAVFICFVLVCIFLVFLYNRFKIIKSQKKIIEQKSDQLAEKNRDILDSIRYAKRIQKALLPTEKYIEKKLNKKP